MNSSNHVIGELEYTNATTLAIADFAMQSTVFFGLTQPFDSVIPQTRFQCPSTNCTFSTFPSVGVCSTYNDLRDMLANKTNSEWENFSNNLAYGQGTGLVQEGTAFILPDSLFIENGNG